MNNWRKYGTNQRRNDDVWRRNSADQLGCTADRFLEGRLRMGLMHLTFATGVLLLRGFSSRQSGAGSDSSHYRGWVSLPRLAENAQKSVTALGKFDT